MAKPRVKFNRTELRTLKGLYEVGATDLQVATIFEIPRKTLTDRLKQNGLTATVQAWKEITNSNVKKSLLQRALGFSSVKKVYRKRKKVLVLVEERREKIAGDVGACNTWLMHRDKEWKEGVPSEEKMSLTDLVRIANGLKGK